MSTEDSDRALALELQKQLDLEARSENEGNEKNPASNVGKIKGFNLDLEPVKKINTLLPQHAEDKNESFFMPMHKTSKNVCKNV